MALCRIKCLCRFRELNWYSTTWGVSGVSCQLTTWKTVMRTMISGLVRIGPFGLPSYDPRGPPKWWLAVALIWSSVGISVALAFKIFHFQYSSSTFYIPFWVTDGVGHGPKLVCPRPWDIKTEQWLGSEVTGVQCVPPLYSFSFIAFWFFTFVRCCGMKTRTKAHWCKIGSCQLKNWTLPNFYKSTGCRPFLSTPVALCDVTNKAVVSGVTLLLNV